MEEQVKKNKLVDILTNKRAKQIIGTILLIGIGITLPRIFHILAGTNAGATFLPMHIAVLIAALVFGSVSGSIVAGSSLIVSYLLTGMPSVTRLPYMLIELVIYAVLVGILNKKMNSYIALVLTIILGRMIYAGILWAAVGIFHLPIYGISLMQSIQVGLPGILLQIACIPFISKMIKKGFRLND